MQPPFQDLKLHFPVVFGGSEMTPLDVISLRFKSGNGNDVPVESVRITAEEWINVQHEFIKLNGRIAELFIEIEEARDGGYW